MRTDFPAGHVISFRRDEWKKEVDVEFKLMAVLSICSTNYQFQCKKKTLASSNQDKAKCRRLHWIIQVIHFNSFWFFPRGKKQNPS